MRARTSLDGWVVVVTGASSGNGKAISLALARKGAYLVLAARRAGCWKRSPGRRKT